ncbi:FAD-dependent oxidoreductase [Tessaracoccus sp. G1721]
MAGEEGRRRPARVRASQQPGQPRRPPDGPPRRLSHRRGPSSARAADSSADCGRRGRACQVTGGFDPARPAQRQPSTHSGIPGEPTVRTIRLARRLRRGRGRELDERHSRMKRPRIAVLGAGIMGSCVALNLARFGADVTLIDRNRRPMEEASRYNEGKIHLGYLYGADASLRTAEHILPGGLAFTPLLSQLLECDVADHATTTDDIYLVDRDSVVAPEALAARFDAVSRLVREHPDASSYLADVSGATTPRLTRAELDSIASERIAAGFRVPERSVETRWVADTLAAAVAAEDRIHVLGETVVQAVTPGSDGGATVRCEGGPTERFDTVVNALWGGRLKIDLTAGLQVPRSWTHRVRWCLFVRTRFPVDVPSAIVSVGPFGDVKNYNGRDFYLSWYPVGLVAQGTGIELEAPALPTGSARSRFIAEVREGLGAALPRIGEVLEAAESITVAGGHVFAEGRGAIGDARSDLHRRDRFGVTRTGSYLSVDTGKYSTAPWMARGVALDIMAVS